MKSAERAATARILMDLIKADNVIDSREMQCFADTCREYSITTRDRTAAFAMTLGHAVAHLRNTDAETITRLMDTFQSMTTSDGYCAREEALIMLALSLTLLDSEREHDIISHAIDPTWFEQGQVLYVESSFHSPTNRAIEANLRILDHELKLCGLDFVYIPAVARHYTATPKPLFNNVVSMLAPNLSKSAIDSLHAKVSLLDTPSFCIEQLHHKLGFTEMADTYPALLIPISHSRVGDETVTNFLRMELGDDPLADVNMLADTFISLNSADAMRISLKRDSEGSFLYSGLYRRIFDILLLQKAVTCPMCIDLHNAALTFPLTDTELTNIYRRERCLYTLFIYEMAHGGINFTPPASARAMARYDARMERLQLRYRRIYAAFGGEPQKTPDITDPTIRRPMISRINKALAALGETIYDVRRFCISRNSAGIYTIATGLHDFQCLAYGSTEPVAAADSRLFAALDKI